MPEYYDAIQASAAQRQYCDANDLPLFAPANGWCVYCGRNIYEPYTYRREPLRTSGIPVRKAGRRHITGCPHCDHSFCE